MIQHCDQVSQYHVHDLLPTLGFNEFVAIGGVYERNGEHTTDMATCAYAEFKGIRICV